LLFDDLLAKIQHAIQPHTITAIYLRRTLSKYSKIFDLEQNKVVLSDFYQEFIPPPPPSTNLPVFKKNAQKFAIDQLTSNEKEILQKIISDFYNRSVQYRYKKLGIKF
jgi:hypothetical protein